jgi:dipicolinate synthase subunit B
MRRGDFVLNIKTRIGFALCGSFCTFDTAIQTIQKLVEDGYEVTPILSDYAAATDTRFGKAADFTARLELITDRKPITTIVEAEPVGPKKLFDLLVIAPCTGNTLAKLNYGVTDTSVTMAAKSHLRGSKPLLIAPSTNDALGGAAKNIGGLLNYKGIYFVPMKQDDPLGKPRSVVSDFTKLPEAVRLALAERQMQPIYL